MENCGSIAPALEIYAGIFLGIAFNLVIYFHQPPMKKV